MIAGFLVELDLHDVTLVCNDWGGAQLVVSPGGSDRVANLVLVSCEAFDNYPPGLPGRLLCLNASSASHCVSPRADGSVPTASTSTSWCPTLWQVLDRVALASGRMAGVSPGAPRASRPRWSTENRASRLGTEFVHERHAGASAIGTCGTGFVTAL